MQYLKNAGEAIFKDQHVKKANELFKPWNKENNIDIGMIGAPLSKSSISHSGASMAPTTIRKAFSSYTTYSIDDKVDIKTLEIHDLGDILLHPTNIVESQSRIKGTIDAVLEQVDSKMWFILGGDHSISYPSIHAFKEKYGNIGIIQFDAHHDLRNLEDGGPTNGTPFRNLLQSNVIKGEQLIQIGIRDFVNSEDYYQYGLKHGVTIYSMKDIRSDGIEKIVKQSVEQLSNKVDMIYISLDMDVVDQAFAPGCPAISPGGISSDDLLNALKVLSHYEKVKAMDIVEIDPFVDFRDMTSKLAAYAILTFLKGRAF